MFDKVEMKILYRFRLRKNKTWRNIQMLGTNL